jgi:hypothetical protein
MPQRILIIRHAEKPLDDGSVAGVTETGEQSTNELIVKGWKRAGALVQFFAKGPLRPDSILAARVDANTPAQSMRPQHTVQALADFLGFTLDLTFAEGDEEALAAELVTRPGTTLVAWEHKIIPKGIANRILGDATTCPQKWPGTRFDVIWIFERESPNDPWTFRQQPQMLLAGDSTAPIPPHA